VSNKEILIVEDQPKSRNTVKFALRGEGYSLFEAESVREGIGRLNEQPNIQVILLDLSLPDGTGRDFLELLRERSAKYRVIILTAHEEELAAKQAREYGVFNYLPKAAKSFTQSIRFSVEQAFNDIEMEQLKDKNKALIEIQKKINSDIQESTTIEQTLVALNNTLNLLCLSVNNLLGTYTCHIRLYNLKTGDFDLNAFAGPSDEIKRIFDSPKRKGEFFSGIVAESKEARLFKELQKDADFQHFKNILLEDLVLAEEAINYLNTIQSAYIAPITTNMFDNEIDAIFNISADSGEFFSEKKQEVIKEFVTQATTAITKAWQKKRKEETHRDYKGISKVLEDISKRLGGVDVKNGIYDIVVNGISEIIQPETISIYLYNKATGLLDNEAEFRGANQVMPHKVGHPTDEGLTGWVFTEGKPLRMPNLQNKDRRKPQEHPNFNKSLETTYIKFIPSGRVDHYLCVPMIIGEEVVGAIQLLNKKSAYHGKTKDKERWLLERGFSDDCENVLGIAASYLAVAIKNAELLEERSKKIGQLETLKDVGRFTSSEMPLNELLSKVIEEAAKDVQAEICLLLLLNEDKNTAVLEESYGIPKERLEGATYEIGRGLTGTVARTGQSILKTSDIPPGSYDDEIVKYLRETYGEHKTIESLMIVPIRAKNEIIGVIKAINKMDDGEKWSEKGDLSFFESFGNYVGIAIENAQRYKLTNEELAIAEKNVALSHLVRAVVHEINNTKALIPLNVDLIKDCISRSNFDLKEMLDVIESSAKRAVEFANNIQAFSASRLGERKTQDINPVIKRAIQELAPSLESDKKHNLIRLEEKLLDEPLECSIYEIPFIQVVQNIILNAYQAMDKSENKVLTIRSYKDSENGFVKVDFTDTGHGIEGKILNDIFDPEFTTKRGKGTGIGLWLAKTHLSSIDADIKVKSVVGEGTTFTIEIKETSTLEEEPYVRPG
jgi:signal transduction histidine kinase/DNA-binding NarL/FixJ family response regulator